MLTDVQVKKLTASALRREIADGKTQGLYLVVQPSGAKSWAVRYRFDGKPRKFTIGPYPPIDLAAARKRAREALGDVAGGKDPAAMKRAAREARTAEQSTADGVEKVAASFVERYARRNCGASWARETERLLRIEVVPKIGAKRIGEVTRADVHDLLDGMVDRGSPVNANRLLAVLRRMFNWCVERGLVERSPCEKLKAPTPEQARDRVLSDEEISVAWRAFERVGWPFGIIAQLLLLTGARRDEIAAGRWGEIDREARTWTIAKERSKNGVAHEIPLSDAAMRIVDGLPVIGSGRDGFVFTTTGGTPVSGWSRAKAQIDAAVLEAVRADAAVRGEKLEDATAPEHWTLHDIRRTAASGMAGLGIVPHVVEAILGHRSGTIKGVAAIYNRYSYAAEKRAALNAWARRLEAIVHGPPSNVIQKANASW
jgi:integrase